MYSVALTLAKAPGGLCELGQSRSERSGSLARLGSSYRETLLPPDFPQPAQRVPVVPGHFPLSFPPRRVNEDLPKLRYTKEEASRAGCGRLQDEVVFQAFNQHSFTLQVAVEHKRPDFAAGACWPLCWPATPLGISSPRCLPGVDSAPSSVSSIFYYAQVGNRSASA